MNCWGLALVTPGISQLLTMSLAMRRPDERLLATDDLTSFMESLLSQGY